MAGTACSGPTARIGHASAYDSLQDRMVVFGGSFGSSGPFDDETWQWDGASWTMICNYAGCGGPTARAGHAMVFDSARQRAVLFGGALGYFGTYYGETWEWDGASWTAACTGGCVPP